MTHCPYISWRTIALVALWAVIVPGPADAQEICGNLPAYYKRMKLWKDPAGNGQESVIISHARPFPPDTATCLQVLAAEERPGYTAQIVSYQVSAWQRIKAYLLIPHHEPGQRLPAVVLLHDHGAHFSIGKEKMVMPIHADSATRADADSWVRKCYDSVYVGDWLAREGFVVLTADALMWGDRQAEGGTRYDMQQALACNMMQMGYSLGGMMLHDDMKAARVLAELDCTDPGRIAAVGFSMGAYRAWLLAAASPDISCCAAACWMSTNDELVSPANNQSKGGSAWSMLIPGLTAEADYPEQAAAACPKPMLIINGLRDKLFPTSGVMSAYGRMHQAWRNQGQGPTRTVCGKQKVKPDPTLLITTGTLTTHLVDAGHVFNRQMQQEVIDFLHQHTAR